MSLQLRVAGMATGRAMAARVAASGIAALGMRLPKLVPAVLAAVLLTACGPMAADGPPSTDTASAEFASLAEKIAFLEQYVRFRRSYLQLDFHVRYANPGGMLPAPSEWDIRIVAAVPRSELEEWRAGLTPTTAPDTAWLRELDSSIETRGVSRWFTRAGAGAGTQLSHMVGVDPERSVVVYRSLNF